MKRKKKANDSWLFNKRSLSSYSTKHELPKVNLLTRPQFVSKVIPHINQFENISLSPLKPILGGIIKMFVNFYNKKNTITIFLKQSSFFIFYNKWWHTHFPDEFLPSLSPRSSVLGRFPLKNIIPQSSEKQTYRRQMKKANKTKDSARICSVTVRKSPKALLVPSATVCLHDSIDHYHNCFLPSVGSGGGSRTARKDFIINIFSCAFYYNLHHVLQPSDPRLIVPSAHHPFTSILHPPPQRHPHNDI